MSVSLARGAVDRSALARPIEPGSFEGAPGRDPLRAAGGVDADSAFAIADRACRASPEPGARAYLLRSLLHASLGREAKSLADLWRAAEEDAADRLVLQTLMVRDPDPGRRSDAARALVADERSSLATLAGALDVLLAAGPEPVVKLARRGPRLSGWAVWRGSSGLVVEARSETREVDVRICRSEERWCPPETGHLVRLEAEVDEREPVEVSVCSPGGPAAVVTLYAGEAPAAQAAPPEGPEGLDVIVPVYGDAAATEACLDALAGQRAAAEIRIWIVDDHSPDPRVAAIAAAYAERLGAHLIVNRVNHGFAGAVNRALQRCPDGDVLLLNADVVLPPDGLDRLMRAAASASDIGSLVPMSNDSAFTSFPVPSRGCPAGPLERARAIDRAAEAANRDSIVDVANTTGFCLYLTRRCRAATGRFLSQAYGRGYYEDVAISLTARERGLRNVAATGLYVSHAGSRSFGEHKRSWVARNLPVLERRHPGYALRCATAVEADPLRAARSGIEEHLRLTHPTHLLVGRFSGRSAALARRAAQIAERGGAVLVLSWGGGEVALRGVGEVGPQSLHFPVDAGGIDRMSAYLGASTLLAIEVDDPDKVPDWLWRRLRARGVPIAALVGSLDTATRAKTGREVEALIALDPMARACLEGGCASTRADEPPPRPKTRIGVPVPDPGVAVDALLLGLVRGFASERSLALVVLGACIDDRPLLASGRVHVTGPIEPRDYAGVLDDYRIDAVFSPYRRSGFGFVDDLARATRLPAAYFDWSGQALRPRSGDLALPYDMPDADALSALAAWCRPVRAA